MFWVKLLVPVTYFYQVLVENWVYIGHSLIQYLLEIDQGSDGNHPYKGHVLKEIFCFFHFHTNYTCCSMLNKQLQILLLESFNG